MARSGDIVGLVRLAIPAVMAFAAPAKQGTPPQSPCPDAIRLVLYVVSSCSSPDTQKPGESLFRSPHSSASLPHPSSLGWGRERGSHVLGQCQPLSGTP